jgi:hypothetical protein
MQELQAQANKKLKEKEDELKKKKKEEEIKAQQHIKKKTFRYHNYKRISQTFWRK